MSALSTKEAEKIINKIFDHCIYKGTDQGTCVKGTVDSTTYCFDCVRLIKRGYMAIGVALFYLDLNKDTCDKLKAMTNAIDYPQFGK